MTGVIFACICKQAEIFHEAKGKPHALEEFQDLMKQKSECEDKQEKEKIYKKLEELEKRTYEDTKKE